MQMRRRWNLPALKEHIRTSEPDRKWLLSTVDSVYQSLCIYEYHKSQAQEAFAAYHAKHDPDGIKMFSAAMMAGTDEELEAFATAKIASEANLIAAINITRNTFDIFAQIVNAVALPCPLLIEDCTISRVRNGLPGGRLRTEITRVTKLHWFQYLAGFSNTIKHRQLISHKPSQKYEKGTAEYLGGGAEVAAFEHNGRKFKSYWVHEVLEGTVEMHNEIITLGITLNAQCLKQALP